jgi:hypothetical protein
MRAGEDFSRPSPCLPSVGPAVRARSPGFRPILAPLRDRDASSPTREAWMKWKLAPLLFLAAMIAAFVGASVRA